MKVSIFTTLLSAAEEARLFEFVQDHGGFIASGHYDSKSAYYNVQFEDKFSKNRFATDYINYKFKRARRSA